MINGNHVAVPTIQGRHNDHTESNGHALSTSLSRKIDITRNLRFPENGAIRQP
jgi:hypothetical protein